MPLSAQEERWLANGDSLFEQSVELTREIIALDETKGTSLANFIAILRDLDAVLNDEIQVLARENLADATNVLHTTETRTSFMILALLAVGLVSGSVTVVAVTRSITGPVGKLVSATHRITEGNSSPRVAIDSYDEFGILGESFNEMIHERQWAGVEVKGKGNAWQFCLRDDCHRNDPVF